MRAAIVLAAGGSHRFGRADKLFALLGGEPLLLHALRTARSAPAPRVVVVAGQPERVRALVRRCGLRGVAVVRLRATGAPLSASLAVAIAALKPVERDALVFLGDMPFVDPFMAARLVGRPAGGASIVRPRHRGVPGHPVLIRNVREVRPSGGDAGFGGAGSIRWIEGGRGCIADIDRRGDLARARRGLGKR